jgi:CO dehydrogenase/acetyl-CoA synthase gamma subunit (corrinoid Fe-S protein)
MAVGAQQPDIVLTDLEQRIFNCLLAVIDRDGLDIQLRVAGGWVRDKVMTFS